jgi:phosphoribosyl 1,2-cyclic phosphodiesterase
MIVISLQSGSNGNCLYVETQGIRLLFDAGIRGFEAERRLASFGCNIRNVDALIISHDHGDHVRHAGIYQRQFGIPLYITPRTLERASTNHRLGHICDVHYFFAGGKITFGEVTVQTMPSPHDGEDGSLFVVCSGKKNLGIFTDLGHIYEELYTIMPLLDAIILESNYDHRMLMHGPYPEVLKQRIQGLEGHLSNKDAAELLQAGSRLQWACLAHLSQNNNTPKTALLTHREIIGKSLPLYTASRHTPTGILNV